MQDLALALGYFSAIAWPFEVIFAIFLIESAKCENPDKYDTGRFFHPMFIGYLVSVATMIVVAFLVTFLPGPLFFGLIFPIFSLIFPLLTGAIIVGYSHKVDNWWLLCFGVGFYVSIFTFPFNVYLTLLVI